MQCKEALERLVTSMAALRENCIPAMYMLKILALLDPTAAYGGFSAVGLLHLRAIVRNGLISQYKEVTGAVQVCSESCTVPSIPMSNDTL